MKNTCLKSSFLRYSCLALVGASVVSAQEAGALATSQKALHTMFTSNILKAAEKMPEEHFSFKPTPDVRSFGQLLGHVADAQYMFCSAVLGEKSPSPGIEKTKTSKADLVQAIKDSTAYCDKAYAGMTDAQAAESIKFFGSERPKLTVLSFNAAHDMEHYGNIVTYMRMKNLVPPSSEGRR